MLFITSDVDNGIIAEKMEVVFLQPVEGIGGLREGILPINVTDRIFFLLLAGNLYET